VQQDRAHSGLWKEEEKKQEEEEEKKKKGKMKN
jgi:hypothetical protein